MEKTTKGQTLLSNLRDRQEKLLIREERYRETWEDPVGELVNLMADPTAEKRRNGGHQAASITALIASLTFSSTSSDTTPILFTILRVDTDLIWNVSSAEVLRSPFPVQNGEGRKFPICFVDAA